MPTSIRRSRMMFWFVPTVMLVLLALLATHLMSPAAFCLLAVIGMLAVLMVGTWPTEFVIGGTLAWMMTGSALASTPFLKVSDAVAGFSNTAVIVVALLFLVAGGVQQTGIMERVITRLLGSQGSERGAILRMAPPLLGLSAFLNNTPIVALFMPLVRDWGVRRRIAPSKLLIPLSFLTIFGGVCTLIGTSTNLVVDGLLKSNGLEPMGMFEIGKLGLPAAIMGTAYLVLFGPRLLPNHSDMLGDPDNAVKEYLLETAVEPGSRLAGKTIDQAGLRDLDGMWLFQVRRGEQNYAPVKREFELREGDRLTFAGERDRVLALHKIPGLTMPCLGHHIELGEQSQLIEVVISASSPLLDRTIREVRFNRKYDATVLAIHRNGERIATAIGDTPLQSGDTLLLIAGIGFRRIWQNSLDFYLVSPLRADLGNPSKGPLAVLILVLMVLLPTLGVADLVLTAMLAVVAMVFTGILPMHNLLRQVEWSVIVVIAAAFGISSALVGSGGSRMAADALLSLSHNWGPIGALIALYLLTNFFTEVITNNAAAALMFPIALQTATSLQVNPRPFIMVIAVAASASFSTPIGYSTNMMIYGPGGYTYRDFLRIGLPLNLLFGVTTLIAAVLWWPLR